MREHADLEFVNGGGTGSLEATAADASVTEIAAGSGLFGGHLFDGYAHFTPAPAAAFALDVVRSPSRDTRRSSAAAGSPRGRPAPTGCRGSAWPEGLRMLARESGEVQTPVTGRRRGAAASRRPRLVPAHEVGRAGRAPRTSSPWSTATRSSTPCRPTEARGRRSCDGDGSGLWRNWARTEAVRPLRVERPGRRPARCSARCEAAAASGLRVKPVGAGHSFTGIAVAPDVQLDLADLSGVIDADVATAG